MKTATSVPQTVHRLERSLVCPGRIVRCRALNYYYVVALTLVLALVSGSCDRNNQCSDVPKDGIFHQPSSQWEHFPSLASVATIVTWALKRELQNELSI